MIPIELGTDDVVERLIVLRRQEEVYYACCDYLSSDHQLMLQEKTASAPTSTSCTSTASSKSGDISEVWREKICEWTFQIIDHFDINREIAFISLNYLDRYLSRRTVNRKTFQLVAMTSLFLAIKLYDSIPLRMSSFIELSRGYFKIEHIAAMETSILWTLSWHVHPPTPLNFVRNFIHLLEQSGCAVAVAHEVKEIARFLTELSVCDYYFTTRKQSSIGLGAVLTAFGSFDEITLPLHVRRTFIDYVRSMDIIDPSSEEVQECQKCLSATYLQDLSYQQQVTVISPEINERGCDSPDCVADVESARYSSKRHCDREF